MKILGILCFTLLATIPAVGQQIITNQPATRVTTSSTAGMNYFEKQHQFFSGKPELSFRATLVKADDDYLIVNDDNNQQQVVRITRYARLEKKHHGVLQKTRKIYLSELVPGSTAKLDTVRDEQGRLMLKKLTVFETVDPAEPVSVDGPPMEYGQTAR